MAGADVIGTAVCIILLVVVCYVVVGSIIMTSGVIINSRNDMTQSQQEGMQTSITIADYRYKYPPDLDSQGNWLYRINFTVLNNGDQAIKNINKTDVLLVRGSDCPVVYLKGLSTGEAASGAKTWYYDGYFDKDIVKTSETLNPGQWDPGEYLVGQVWITGYDPAAPPLQLRVVLPNGITATNIKTLYYES